MRSKMIYVECDYCELVEGVELPPYDTDEGEREYVDRHIRGMGWAITADYEHCPDCAEEFQRDDAEFTSDINDEEEDEEAKP